MKNLLVLVTILLVALAQDDCITKYCSNELNACATDGSCINAWNGCAQKCPTDLNCFTVCIAGTKNTKAINLLNCAMKNCNPNEMISIEDLKSHLRVE